jgi:peptide/nickel transport system permease protein
MTRYVLGRLLQVVLILLAVSVLAFAVMRLVPGDPAKLILGVHATPAAVEQLRGQLGLDAPLLTQYLDFLGGVLQFDFGESLRLKQPVWDLLLPNLWPTLWLVVYACVLATVVVVPLAILAATRRNRPADHAIRVASTIGYATPPFFAGLLLVLVFSLKLGWFPVAGYGTGLLGHVESLTLPAVTVALSLAPPLLRTLRSGLLETLGQDYVEAARARGLSHRRVLCKHALRNSMLPALTVLGLSVGWTLSAAVIVENVFAIPGLGSLLVSSVTTRDYPVVQALMLVFAAMVLVASLVTDLLYFVVDPRIRP